MYKHTNLTAPADTGTAMKYQNVQLKKNIYSWSVFTYMSWYYLGALGTNVEVSTSYEGVFSHAGSRSLGFMFYFLIYCFACLIVILIV